MKYHTKQWFFNRVGKRVYRLTKYKCCQHCDDSFENGIVVNDAFHAGCLFDYQNEMGYEYGDEKIIKMETKCDICGKEKEDVSYRPNAYAQDVGNDPNAYHTVCDNCNHENEMDI